MAKHRYTILSMMKDEGHSLLEWVAYHHLIGFDNICVYTNNCGDGTDRMLMRLQEMGYCQHFENVVPEGKRPQPNALQLALKNDEVLDSEWILTMDADEFVNIKVGGGTVDELIAAIPDDAEGVAITWRFYGSSEILDWRPGLVIESYRRGAPDRFRKGWGVKTLFKPYPHMRFGIHRPTIKQKASNPDRVAQLKALRWVNGAGRPMTESFKLSGWRSTGPTLGYDFVELNHYAVKSFEAYLLRRLRGNVNNKEEKYNAGYFSIFDRNEVDYDGAARHGPRVRALMDQMLQDPQLAALQAEALAFHEANVARLRSTGEYDEWVESLRRATKVRIDQLDQVLFTKHLPQETQDLVKRMQADGIPDSQIALMIAKSKGIRDANRRGDIQDAEELSRLTGVPLDAVPNSDPLPDDNTTPPAVRAVLSDDEKRRRVLAAIQHARTAARSRAATQTPDDGGTAPKPPRPKPILISDGGVLRAAPPKPPAAPQTSEAPMTDLPFPPNPGRQQKPFPGDGRKVVVSTMKNEGPYLVEWIAHYLELGFDHFVLFSNDCTDGTNLILNRLDAMGIVDHYDNPLGPRMDPQRRAYSRANKLAAVRGASWVLIVDADEFLNVHVGDGTVDALIDAAGEDAEAISINWRLFGSGGARHMDDAPVTRRFTRACNVVEPENGLIWGFKTLFRPASFDYFGVHRPRFEKSREILPDQVKWVSARGEDMGAKYLTSGWRSNSEIVAYDWAQINHYAIKSREEFLLKRLRGTANSKDKDRIDLGYWDKFDLNACEDASIRSGDLDGRMAALLADPDLAALHRATLDAARRQIAEQTADPELQAFVEGEITPAATDDTAAVAQAAETLAGNAEALAKEAKSTANEAKEMAREAADLAQEAGTMNAG